MNISFLDLVKSSILESLKKANYINHLLATDNFDQIYFDSWKSLEHINTKYQSENLFV